MEGKSKAKGIERVMDREDRRRFSRGRMD